MMPSLDQRETAADIDDVIGRVDRARLLIGEALELVSAEYNARFMHRNPLPVDGLLHAEERLRRALNDLEAAR